MNITLVKPGQEALLIEAAKLLNDTEVSFERASELLRDASFFLLVALDDSGSLMGRIYGYVIPRFAQTDLELYEVDVLDAHQRKGVGRAMLEFVKSFAKERGYKELWVLTEGDNEPAKALYGSVGGILEAFPTAMYVFYV
ncbi:MAG TPA: GNAT family N-acetyltransferase [Candidatus Kapabacteria bacterium]